MATPDMQRRARTVRGAVAAAQYTLMAMLTVASVQASPPAAAGSAAATANEWWGHGGNSREQRFSPLRQVSASNVSQLGLAWSLDLPGEASLSATPLEVGGVIYFSGSVGNVYAVDARSGRQLWKYEPDINRPDPRQARMFFATNRGVAYWDGAVFVALKDGRMVALNAANGAVLWITRFLLKEYPASSTGAPRAFKGKIIIGSSGAEQGGRGYVTTLDARTGRILWRFFLVPGNPANGPDHAASDSIMPMATKTWSGEWWKFGGGGTAWNGITYDAELNQIYVGTGNGGPWAGKFRSDGSKDNLFLTSVVALDADTGHYRWHYQYNPYEVWDWKATADIVLADLRINGRLRKVLMHAPSNGFFYVIDRRNGKLISAEKYAKVNWADRIDLNTGRPVERPGIRYEKEPFTLYPGFWGAHNWQASSYNPITGLVYIPYIQVGSTYANSSVAETALVSDPTRFKWRLGIDAQAHFDRADPMDGKGSLLAWDPVKQRLRWRVDHAFFWNGGTMTTAGNLVFQGDSNGQFVAYNAATGKSLWSFNAKLGIVAPPISYAVNGRQYVSILVGWGTDAAAAVAGMSQGWKYGQQPRRLLTFSLGGQAALPDTPPQDFSVHALDDPSLTLEPERVARGETVYGALGLGACSVCHGDQLDAMGLAPDLRESSIALDRAALAAFLRSGALISRNMPKYDDLSDEEIEDLYQYIRAGARRIRSVGTPASH
jgi:quinohemoprotein ethanol dehydrogenase